MPVLYTPILNEKDAEKVLSDLSILWYAFAILLGALVVGSIIFRKGPAGHYPILTICVYVLTGYYLPLRKSRVLSIVILAQSIWVAAYALWFFLYLHPPSFSLSLLKNIITLIVLLIPLWAVSCAWAAYRTTMATFIYHRHYSQLKENTSPDKTSSL